MKEIYPGPETVDEMFSKYVFDVACHQDEGIRQQLIKLGWIAPEIDRGKNALLEDMSDDIDELIADNALLSRQNDILEMENEKLEQLLEQSNRTITQLYRQISLERRGIYET